MLQMYVVVEYRQMNYIVCGQLIFKIFLMPLLTDSLYRTILFVLRILINLVNLVVFC